MTQVAEKKPEVVMVKCLGIAIETGFSMSPEGLEPTYVSFLPGQAKPVLRPYAEYLISQDPTRFFIEEPAAQEKSAQQSETEVKPSAKAAKKAKVKKK